MRPTLLVLATLLLAGCFGGADNAPATNDSTGGSDNETDTDMTITPVALSIALVERPGVGIPPTTMALDPATLEVKEDQRVSLTITNGGQAPHNLVIEGMDVATDTLGAGDELVVEFVPQERGEFVMYCAVGGDGPTGHRAQGMTGTFVVT